MQFLNRRIRHEFLDSCSRIERGSLSVITPEGTRHHFGTGAPAAGIRLHDWAAVTAAAARGDIGLGESYVEGLWDTPSVEAVATVALSNMEALGRYTYAGLWQGLKFRLIHRLVRANSRGGAARNIRAHYDVGNEFYQLWLDRTMTYSSAIYGEGDTLEIAQARKYDRILNSLGGGAGVLEIGCGWGGFAERAADQGREVTAITLSPAQKGYADARLDGRAEVRLQDYRDTRGRFDNIVSIEMIEAVGERYWPAYFATLKSRLAEGGRAVVQAITVPDSYFPTYRRSADYIRHYTFPGGMLLCDGAIRREARRAGLAVEEIHAFGGHYARTLRDWLHRMEAEVPRIHRLGFDEAFLRGWRFYLGICAAAFETGQTDVVQVRLAHG